MHFRINPDIRFCPEADAILGKIPSWIVRWGVTVVAAIFIGILVGCYFIKYPDLVQVPIAITTVNPSADLLQIQSQMENAANDLFMARNTYDIARLSLCQLLGTGNFSSFHTIAPEEAVLTDRTLPQDIEQVVDAALTLPQVKMAELGIDMARRDICIAQATYFPAISLGAAYGSSYSDARRKPSKTPTVRTATRPYPFFEQYNVNANKHLSVSLNIPTFDRLAARKNVRRSKVLFIFFFFIRE